MRSIIFALALLASPVAAADYMKPAGAPEAFLPSHNATVSVFAVQTAIGHGIGVFELRSGTWFLCGTCIIAEFPNMDQAVAAAGGPGPYVASKLSAINAILASRYPNSEPVTTIGRVNQALGIYRIGVVNGVPVLSP